MAANRLTRLTGLRRILTPAVQWAISSAGERSPHTGEVTGSIPVSPTNKAPSLRLPVSID